MSQDQDSPSQLSGLFGPTLIVAIGGLVAYFTIEPALESRRPDVSKHTLVPPPPTVPGLNAIHSRLWDDPLAVAYEDSRRRHGDAGAVSQLLSALSRKARCLNSDEADVQRYFAHVAGKILDHPGNHGLLCLPVLVPGEPYDSDTEERKRIAYAVLSALAACGYELSVPDRVSYVQLAVIVHVPSVDETVCLERFVVPVKLFERSDVSDSNLKSGGPDGVFVLWINEDQLGHRPLAAIGQILEGLFGKIDSESKKAIDIRIIGPVDSDTLQEMAQEDADWASRKSTPPMNASYRAMTEPKYFSTTYGKDERIPTLYSGRATISVGVLDNEKETESSRKVLSGFTNARSTNAGISVVRTIGSDLQLANLLARELKLREAWPLRDDALMGPDSVRHEKLRHVVLVTESDTLYGRALPALFRKAFPLLLATRTDPVKPGDQDLLHVFTYLRGLDGKVPGDKKEGDENRDDSKKTGDSASDPLLSQNPETIPASGRSQFDYLRRLEEELVDIDQTSRDAGEEGIKAIGVVGSDVYDKLLVLRALRKRFPRTWFFSTDLDAALALPSEYPTTRNLIVASHFGLTLNPHLQRSALPFRDVYQTSTYFSTLLALDDDAAKRAISESRDPWELSSESDDNVAKGSGLSPLVFEIGRSGPYQLTIPAKEPSESSQKVHPQGSRESHWLTRRHAGTIFLLVLLAGAGIGCFEDKRQGANVIFRGWRCADWNAERIVLRITALILTSLFVILLYVAVADHTNPSGEPFVLFEGISIWPPTILRFLVVVLSTVFIARAVDNVQRQLRPKLQELSEAAAAPGKCGTQISEFRTRECPFFYLKRSLFLAACFVAFSSLLIMITERPPAPFRGPMAERWQFSVLCGAALAMIWLTFFVLTRIESCRRFVKALGAIAADWASVRLKQLEACRQPVESTDLGELLTVRVIAETTDAVGKSIKYPFIVLFVMILSRHPALDKLELPWSLVAIWALIVAVLSWGAHALRRDAQRARDEVLGRLRDALSVAWNSKIDPSNAASRVQQLQQYMSEIEAEDRGAFQPLIRDPLVQALALGTSGGLMLIHQLLPYV